MTLQIYKDKKDGSLCCGKSSIKQKELIHKEEFGLNGGESGLTSIKKSGDNQLHLDIDLIGTLRGVLLALVALEEQIIKPWFLHFGNPDASRFG